MSVLRRFLPASRAEIDAYIDSQVTPVPNLIVSSSEILSRFHDRYEEAFKESNRFHLFSIVVALIYLVKIAGFRLDLVFLDQKVFELPYGVFIFCVLSLILYSVGCIRTCDAQIYDMYIRVICKRAWPGAGDLVYRSYVGSGVWWFNFSDLIEDVQGRLLLKISYWAAAIIFAVLAVTVIAFPLLSGFYFLLDWKTQATGEFRNLQYYAVLTCLAMALSLSVLVICTYQLNNAAFGEGDP